MSRPDSTRVVPPSDSVLLTLARAAMAAPAPAGEATFPRLDLDDPEQRQFGDYELLEEIGRGGMGVVYRAHQRSLDREVAIKFIASGLADGNSVARFLSEARAAARLMHPRIVPVHEVGSIDGLHYFSMPLVRGRTLSALLDDGPMAVDAAVTLLLALCDAIGYAHSLGLLHLDLKPANILFDERGEPLVADFGLARHVDGRGGVDAQEVSGTPAYMAPEQILIRQYRLTRATDIYALGAILYRCLTGLSPHGEGAPDDVIRRAAAGRIPSPRENRPALPRDLEAVCLACLELQPGDRYAGVSALADDLRRVRDGLPVSVRRAGVLERARRWYRREPRLALASTAAVLSLLLGVAATGWQWRQATIQRDLAVVQRDAAETARREADAERERVTGTAALGAWLYADGPSRKNQEDYAAAKARATRMLEWLRGKYPDEAQQAAALIAFLQALDAAGTAEHHDRASMSLLEPLVDVAGGDYRRAVIDALLAGDDPQRHVLAAPLVWHDESEDPEAPRFRAVMDQAIAAHPDDPVVWNMAAHLCTGPGETERCHYPDALRRLIEVDPDNGFAWLQLSLLGEGEAARVALREAARRDRFADYVNGAWARAFLPFERSGVPVPRLIAEVGRVMWPNDTPHATFALVEAERTVIPVWRLLIQRCDRANGYFVDPEAYADCLAVAVRMARSRESSLFTNMMGAYLAQRLAAGTPLAEEMRDVRRQFFYLAARREELPTPPPERRHLRRYYEAIGREGEVAAEAADYGITLPAPADWQPADPRLLMVPEERAAEDRRRAAEAVR